MRQLRFRTILHIIISLIALLLLTFIFLLTTTPGARITLVLFNAMQNNTLAVENINGRLIDTLTLKNVDYHDPNQQLHIKADQIKLNWSVLILLNLNRTITLDVTKLNIEALTDDAHHTKFPLMLQHGKLIITGKPSQYHAELDAKVDIDQTTNNQMSLVADGNLTGSKKFTLHIAGEIGNGSIQGNIFWSPMLTWQLQLDIDKLNTRAFSPQLPQLLSFQGTTSGQWHNDINLKISLPKINGIYQQHNFSGNIDYKQQHLYRKGKLQLQLADAKIDADLQSDKQLLAHWKITIPKLSNVNVDLQGQLNLQGTVTGTLTQPWIRGTINGNQLQWQHITLDTLQQTFDVHLDQTLNFSWKTQLSGLSNLSYKIDQLILTANGNKARHQAKLNANNDQFRLLIATVGGIKQHTWSGKLTTLSLSTKIPQQQWQLTHPVAISIANNQYTVAPFCWKNARQGRICGEFSKMLTQWNGKLNLDQLPLNLLTRPFGHTAKGQVNGNIELQQKQDQLIGQGKITLSPGNIVFPVNDREMIFSFIDSYITFLLNSDGLQSEMKLALDQQQMILLKAKLPDYNGKTKSNSLQTVQGTITTKLTDLSWITILEPNLTDIKGILNGKITINGTLDKPAITGKINLDQGHIHVLPLGLTLQQLVFQLTASKANQYAWQGQLTSGKGKLQLDGKTTFNQDGLSTNGHIQGEEVEVINNSELYVITSPKLNIKQTPKRIDISGTLTVPKADIHPLDLSSAVTLPDETVIIHPDQADQKIGQLATYANIELVLGDQIKINAQGLLAKLQGKLHINSSPQTATTAKGHLQIVNGTFRLLGKKLKISEGRLLFTGGNINNPDLTISASKTMTIFNQATNAENDTLTVGVRVTGNVDQPIVTLFSKPSGLSQSEILSYLVLGKPLDQVTPTDSATLVRALATLNGKNQSSTSITEDIQHTLGLDDLSVGQVSEYDSKQGDTVSNTDVVLGKALSPDLYVSYSVGLFTPVNIFRVRYRLGRGWSVQATNSELGTGGDLFYSFSIK